MRAPASVSPFASAVPRPPRPTHTSETASLAAVPLTDSGLTIVNADAAPATALVRTNSRLLIPFFGLITTSLLRRLERRITKEPFQNAPCFVCVPRRPNLEQALENACCGSRRLFDRRGE